MNYDIDIIKGYSSPETHIVLHKDDPDLCEINIPILSGVPILESICNYGLPKNEQKFRREVIPERLLYLWKRGVPVNLQISKEDPMSINAMWRVLKENQYEYKEEILFIKKSIYYFYYGKWVYINGVPTYIPPSHWFYYNYWELNIGLPSYRDYQRWNILAWDYFRVSTKDYTGKDWGYKLFMGVNIPKYRQGGITGLSACDTYCNIIKKKYSVGGIQANTGDIAKKVFDLDLIFSIKKLPFWHLPNYYMSDGIIFSKIPDRTGKEGSKIIVDQGLESRIIYSASEMTAFDTYAMDELINEEMGKTKNVDVDMRWDKQRPALLMKQGFAKNIGQVGDMELQGGVNFEKLCLRSMYDNIDKNGQTESSLVTMFIPSYYGLAIPTSKKNDTSSINFIDEFGNSVVDTPTTEQAKYIKSNIGAKEYLRNRRDFLEKSDKVDKLSEELRIYPFTFRECFSMNTARVGFNVIKINSNLSSLKYGKEQRVRGDLKWKDNNVDTVVEFIPNNDNGKFYFTNLSRILKTANQKVRINMADLAPLHKNLFSAGSDSFKFDVTRTHSRNSSKGAGAVFMNRDEEVDRDDIPVEYWNSYEFCCTYLNRPSTSDIYCEDMLMMCVFVGAMMYPENEIDTVFKYFSKVRSNGLTYRGYLNFDINEKTNKFELTPGGFSSLKNKQIMFNDIRDWSEVHICHNKHPEVAEEILLVKGIDDLRYRDLLTALLYAKRGAQNSYIKKYEKRINNRFNTPIFKKY